jgi:hypothetical protein
MEDSPYFFVDEGRTNHAVERTGFMADLFNNLAREITQQTDPDDVMDKLIGISQNAITQLEQPNA